MSDTYVQLRDWSPSPYSSKVPPSASAKHDARERHVWTLARPERVEVAQHDDVEAELAAIRVGEMFARQLGDAVRRERVRRRVLRRRVALGRAVHGRGRGEDDADAVPRRRLEQALRGELVPAKIEREDVAEAVDARLAGEMEDPVDAGEVERVVGEVDAPDVEVARVLLLQRRVVVVGEDVEPHHFVAVGQEPLGEVRADEAGGAGDHVPHRGQVSLAAHRVTTA